MLEALERKRQTLTPPLKWAGGKTWLVPRMNEIYRSHREKTWVDPFCGGLALPLALLPERAILGDINHWLINFYGNIRSNPRFIAAPIANTKVDFYKARVEFNTAINCNAIDNNRMAQLFYYLNRTCFNGLCRFNSAGEFNTPYANYSSPQMSVDFSVYRELFTKWQFEQGDFFLNECISYDNAFVYIDPPYDDGFVGYSGNRFGWEQQQKLVETTDGMDCPIVISNKATDRIIELYKSHGFTIEILSAPRRIAASGNRQKVHEVLATKNI